MKNRMRRELFVQVLQTVTSSGRTIGALSREGPLVVVFLRHTGCTLFRKSLAELAAALERIWAAQYQVLVVHMGDDADGRDLINCYRLAGVYHVADPERRLYQAFGLKRGRWLEVLDVRLWWHGFWAAIIEGRGSGRLREDGLQLGGAFLVEAEGVASAAEFISDTVGLDELSLGAGERSHARA